MRDNAVIILATNNFNMINKFLKLFGLKLIISKNWRVLSEFEKMREPFKVLKIVKKNSMLSDIRLINIKEVVEYVERLKFRGAYVECGVWKGGSVGYAAYQLRKLNWILPIHLFDVFDDICEPDADIDGERAIRDVGGRENAKGRLRPIKGVYSNKGGHGKEVEVQNLLSGDIIKYPERFVNIHKGWFQDTLPSVSSLIGPISILRLDGDWYSSTKVCLENLYQFVEKGGVIIIDDYGCYDGCKKAVDEFLEKNGLNPFLIKVDDECIFFVK